MLRRFADARELDLDGICTDVKQHAAELAVDVVDCVGCHVAVTDVPVLVAEVRRLRAELDELRRHLGEAVDVLTNLGWSAEADRLAAALNQENQK